MPRPQKIACTLFIASLLAAVPSAHAAVVVFSNFGPSDAFQSQNGYSIGFASSFGNTFAQAMAFTPSGANYTLDAVELPLFPAFGRITNNSIDLAVRVSDASGLPGAFLESFHLTNAINRDSIVMAVSSAHPLLSSGVQYWLSAALSNPSASNDLAGWDKNLIGDMSAHASFKNAGPWQSDAQPAGAFRIDGSPITVSTPEPSNAFVFVVALTFIASGRKRALRGLNRTT